MINAVNISLIKPFVLPNFILQRKRLEDSFPLSERNYALFYLKGERSKYFHTRNQSVEVKHLPQEIRVRNLDLGLVPMPARHTLRSFWKTFRLKYQRESPINEESARKLFSFLPLKLKLPIYEIVIKDAKYPVRIRAYLFPFGVCCVNLQIRVDSVSYYFDEVIDLLQKFGRYTFYFDEGRICSNFDGFAKSIAEDIDSSLFGIKSSVIPFSTHTVLFIKKTSKALLFDLKAQNLANIRKGIAALLTCNKFIPNSPQKEIEEILNGQLKSAPGHEDEILLFNKKGTFIYPSSSWINQEIMERKRTIISRTSSGAKKELDITDRRREHSFQCMHNNYEAVLTLLLSSNSFLYGLKKAKGKIPKQQISRWIQNLGMIFPDEIQEIDYHYKHAIGKIAKEIQIYNNLKEFAPIK